MKSKDKIKKYNFEVEYQKIVKDFQIKNIQFQLNNNVTNPSELIVKFSLYEEIPNSITSTETSVII